MIKRAPKQGGRNLPTRPALNFGADGVFLCLRIRSLGTVDQNLINRLFQNRQGGWPLNDKIQTIVVCDSLAAIHQHRCARRTHFDDVRHFPPRHSCHNVIGDDEIVDGRIKRPQGVLGVGKGVDDKSKIAQK